MLRDGPKSLPAAWNLAACSGSEGGGRIGGIETVKFQRISGKFLTG
jgi:hypothetical protein